MLEDIAKIASKAGIDEKYLVRYGNDKAKIELSIFDELENKKNGKLILVTAITPTKAGEGKTTTAIALHDGMRYIGKNSMLALREPSMGPVFGLKGGATGGGRASIEPSEDINLHFTGDMHALTSSINLISAIIDNHIFQGNQLNIDPNRITWKRALDMNDRALREISIAHGEKNGVVREDGFVITVASEMMAILCLAKDPDDFRKRINNILVAYTYDGKPVYLRELGIDNAIMKIMKHALKPNIVQTLENNPVLVHGGPFANIAHGCNSIIALKLACKLGDYAITEAGFGADLGAEKFLDICLPNAGLKADGCVMVATIRALKLHGGVAFEELTNENVPAMLEGTKNLRVHLENIKKFGLPVVIAINRFASDTDNEVKALTEWCKENGYEVALDESFAKGSEGAVELANKVVAMLDKEESKYHTIYDKDMPIKDKIEAVCKTIYGASNVVYTDVALEKIANFEKLGYGKTPVCMAKTPLSLTDNPKIQNAPTGFDITIRDVNLSAGAGFIVALTGKIVTMPGLPKVPAALKM